MCEPSGVLLYIMFDVFLGVYEGGINCADGFSMCDLG